MRKLAEYLGHLSRSGVTEVVLTTGQRVRAFRGTDAEPIDESRLTSSDILTLLFQAGGSRYVEDLGSSPATWTTRVSPVGTVTIAVTQRGREVEARVRLVQRKDRDAGPPTQGEAHTGEAKRDPGSERFDIREDVVEVRGDARARRRDPRMELTTDPPPAKSPASMGPITSKPTQRLDSPTQARVDDRTPPAVRPPAVRPPAERPPGATATRTAASEATETFSQASDRSGPPLEGRRRRTSKKRKATRPDDQDFQPSSTASPARPADSQAPPSERTKRRRRKKSRASISLEIPSLGGAAAPKLSLPGFVSAPKHPPSRIDDALRDLVAVARSQGATDLHLAPDQPVLARLGGDLSRMGDAIPKSKLAVMLSDTIVPERRDRFQRYRGCEFSVDLGDLGRVRFNVSESIDGLKASLRLLFAEEPTSQALGLPSEAHAATHHHQGLVVVTGPAGHGKSTTVAALVDELNRSKPCHIITLEDPIEYVYPRKTAVISQREIGTHTKNYQSALSACLREDPDVIMVGELRDLDSMRMALSASETGHLVIGTMSTPNAARTIDRLIDMFPPDEQPLVRTTLAGGLRMVLSQRLIPTPDRRGVKLAVETLPGSLALWNLIRDGKTFQIPSLQQRGKSAGITRMDDSLAALAKSGSISHEDAIEAAQFPDELRQQLLAHGPVASRRLDTQDDGDRPRGFFERAGALFRRGGD